MSWNSGELIYSDKVRIIDPDPSQVVITPPDLRGDYFNVVQEPLKAGDAFDVNFRVRNAGPSAAPSSNVKFYLSSDNTIAPDDYYLGSYALPTLGGATTTSTLSKRLRLPFQGATYWNGNQKYYIGMIVDADDQVIESDGANNRNTREFADYDGVDISDTFLPDPLGAYFNVVQEPLDAGDNFTVTFQVRNAGAAAAGHTDVGIYISRDSNISSLNDRLLGTYSFSSLAAGATSATSTAFLRLPAPGDPFWAADTTYYIGMIIDPDDDVIESRDSNNANQAEFKDWDRVAVSGTSPGPASLVGRAPGGAWWLGRSNGSAFTNQLWGVWSDSVTWQDVVVGDFNGDLRPDIAGRAGGQWWVARSTGNSFVTELWGAWSNGLTWQDVQVGDFDGDGRADIAGRAAGTMVGRPLDRLRLHQSTLGRLVHRRRLE